MNAIRRAKYKSGTPMQTQTGGFQQLIFAIMLLFEQTLDLMQAESLERIAVGERLTKSEIDYFRRQFRCAVSDLKTVDGLTAALPVPIHFESDDIAGACQKLSDLAQHDGRYRRHFDKAIQSVLDDNQRTKSTAIKACVEQMKHQHGIEPALRAAKRLQNELNEATKKTANAPFTEQDEKSLERCACQILAATSELSGHNWWQRCLNWRKRREISSQREAQVARARKLTKKRLSELEDEAKQLLAQRLINVEHQDSLTSIISSLDHFLNRLTDIAMEMRNRIEPLEDSIIETQLVRRADELLLSGYSLADTWTDQCERHGCGPSVHAEMIKLGLQVQGRIVSLANLVSMTNDEAIECLRSVNTHLHNENVIDAVLETNLATPSLEAHLIRALKSATNKAAPYLETLDILNVNEINETYVFAHPDLRRAISKALPATVTISNPEGDSRLHVEQRHAVAIYRSQLTCGHARPSYLKGLLIKRRLEATGKRAPVYDLGQALGDPLVIKFRPTTEQDSQTLFQIAFESGSIAKVTVDKEVLFTVAPMDDTVRFCFERRSYRRRLLDATQFRRLMAGKWFVPFVDSCGLPLPADWSEDVINTLSAENAIQTAERLVQLGIAERKDDLYKFAVSVSNNRIVRDELYQATVCLKKGIPKPEFIQKMLSVDELYTRVFIDVLLAERGLQIEQRQLPPFARAFLDEMFDRELQA